ncbi:334_t:CDS:2, partial [Acaulospora colombiana]
MRALEESKHRGLFRFYSPKIVKMYLKQNKSRLLDLRREEILNLLDYILRDKDIEGLHELRMMPLADGTLGMISRHDKDDSYIFPDIREEIGHDEYKIFFKDLGKFIDNSIPSTLWNLLYEGAVNKWNLNVKILTTSVVADLIKKNLEGYSAESDEIELKNQREWVYHIWDNLTKREYDLKYFESIHLIPTNRGTLRKIKTNERCFWNTYDDKLDSKIKSIMENFGAVFVDKEFERHSLHTWQNSYPKNLKLRLQTEEVLEIMEYLNSHLQIENLHDKYSGLKTILVDVIKDLPIFSESDRGGLISFHGNKRWVLVGKLFDHLGSLLLVDPALKVKLSQVPFVTSDTYKMSINRHDPDTCVNRRPVDLYNPEDRKIACLFFEYERVFPSGNFTGSSKRMEFLKELGLKTYLTHDDIINRLNTIISYKNKDNNPELFDAAHTKAMKLLKYIDNNWKFLFENSHKNEQFFDKILSNEWIPTIDHLGKKHFSKPTNCRDLENKYLIGYVMPILDYRIKKKKFFKLFGWDKNPDIELIIHQLWICSQRPKEILEIYDICKAIYDHMNGIVTKSVQEDEINKLKEKLKDMKWIMINRQFYSSANVAFDLSRDFGNRDTLIVGLPDEYKLNYEELFKRMGVRLKPGILEYIDIIKAYSKDNTDVKLSIAEISRVTELIDWISKEYSEDGSMRILQELLVPTTHEILINLSEVQYDDMGMELTDEEKNQYHIAHSSISLNVAKNIGMNMLSTKLIDVNNVDDFMPELYEQKEDITTRIKHIINDYLPEAVFKEFLQNADDAGARIFKLYIDKRDFRGKNKSSLLTDEIDCWQGPALWIYNDAIFKDEDFKSLLKLGSGNKLSHKSKIGRFGIGFNSAFNFTDLPSFVSGEHIAFLDPHSVYLPKLGYPPRNPLGNRYNFVKSNFNEKLYGQAEPYLSIEGCDLTTKYHGTLFRIPLRSSETADFSKISNKIFNPDDLKNLFKAILGNGDLLFLRNVEECSLHYLDLNGTQSETIWKTKINNIDENIRNMRCSITNEAKIFQLYIETQVFSPENGSQSTINEPTTEKKIEILEQWLLCSGGNENIIEELKLFSDAKKLFPRGGVAALIAQTKEDNKVNYLTNIRGEMYSYLPLLIRNNLSVMLNGDFFLSSDRRNILLSEDDSENKEVKWNRYILLEVLPPLHATLLNEIAILDSQRLENMRKDQREKFTPYTMTRDWPIVTNSSGIYRMYGITVLQQLARNNYSVFWTEANSGEFISFFNAVFAEKEKETIINEILIQQDTKIVKLSKEQYEHIRLLTSEKNSVYPSFIDRDLICRKFRDKNRIWDSYTRPADRKDVRRAINYLLNLILEDAIPQDIRSYERLIGLPLVPLCGGTVGTFCEKEYYIADENQRKLFNKTKSSHFISELPINLKTNMEVLKLLKIYNLNAKGIIKLLEIELPEKEKIEWDPSGNLYPNKEWIDQILKSFDKESDFEFNKFARYPLLPMILPRKQLIQFDKSNPLLFRGNLDDSVTYILSELGIGFTDLVLSGTAHPTLKECIIQPTKKNIYKSIAQTMSYSRKSLEQVFKQLTQKGDESSLETPTQVLEVIRDFPIWPVYSSDDFIAAHEGCLLKSRLKIYSLPEMKIFRIESDTDYNSLKYLKSRCIDELEYITYYYYYTEIRLDSKYIEFLKRVLLLGNNEIENHLCKLEVIPNKNHTMVSKVNELYDVNVPLFRDIFGNTNKFLPLEFQENPAILNTLGRMGLKRRVDSHTFLECAREIEDKARETTEITVVKQLAKTLMMKLFSCYEELQFDSNQWKELMIINFVPTDTNIPKHYEIHKNEIVALNSVCFYKYKNLVWTQVPLLDRFFDPPQQLLIDCPNICKPELRIVIDHWYEVALKSSKSLNANWRSYEGQKQFVDMMKEIYEYLNSQIDDLNQEYIRSRIFVEENLFLNDEDYPFESESWVSGSSLFLGISKDIDQGLRKVSPFLEKYKTLLNLAGARELKIVEKKVKLIDHDQKAFLLDNMLKLFMGQERSKHHDVEFIFPNNEKIYANRYVLSAAAEHFKNSFCGDMNESNEFKRVSVEIDYCESDAFRVFICWLYGQSFEALKAVIVDQDDYLQLLIELLKASNAYMILPLKAILEKTIIDEISVDNVIEIKKWADECEADQLKEHFKRYIEVNGELVVKIRQKDMDNIKDEEERELDKEMLEDLIEEINKQ